MKLRPLFDKIVVKREEARKKSEGGILIPDSAQEKTQKGEVLAVGPGRWSDTSTNTIDYPNDVEPFVRYPVAVKVGDVVLFQKWAGNDHKELGDDIVVLSEGDILGVFEPDDKGKGKK